jgi:DNA-directed RNA polymerase II subunit RPB1
VAKDRTICEASALEGEQDEDGNRKPGHGGCGARQPQIRKEGLMLFTVYKGSDVRSVTQFEP